MAKKITKIPATLNRFNLEPVVAIRKRRVAGYARVSTDRDEQATSYEAQMAYYKAYIENREDWEFVGMYSDEGISATNTKKRDGFKQMIEDALAGKIDLIITKSVSRFARNTVDSLSTIRKLKEKGVEVYFEKENIWTLDAKGEMLLTIMSSFAQEESRSISENTTWGKRKQFADGKGAVAYSRFLGYDKDFEINEEEAKIIRLIFRLFISGKTFYGVAQEMERRGIPSPAGRRKWYASTVKSIITNKKYKGDALLQKQYTTDFLQKKRKKNEGEIPQYYVEGHHKPIIPPPVFDYVQAEIVRRSKMGRYSGADIFANKVRCGCCGNWYGAKVWHSQDKYRRVIYRCNKKYQKGKEPCESPHFSESELKEIFMKALNLLIEEKEECIDNLKELIEDTCQTDELEVQQERLEAEIELLTEKINSVIRENTRIVQDQEEYQKKEDTLRNLYEKKKEKLGELNDMIQERKDKRGILTNFIMNLQDLDGEQVEFREELWGGILDEIVAEKDKSCRVIFRGGIEVTI